MLCACFAFGHVMAQQVVTGRVTTSDGGPVIGATVKIKGTDQGTVTGAAGQFSLEASPGSILVVSYVGMQEREVAAGKVGTRIVLRPSNARLNDVVVLGYETTTRKGVTSSIASVSAKDIAPWSTGNVANALEGKVPGLQVISGGGLPGAQLDLRFAHVDEGLVRV